MLLGYFSNVGALLVRQLRRPTRFLIRLPNRIEVFAKHLEEEVVHKRTFVEVMSPPAANAPVSTLDQMPKAVAIEGLHFRTHLPQSFHIEGVIEEQELGFGAASASVQGLVYDDGSCFGSAIWPAYIVKACVPDVPVFSLRIVQEDGEHMFRF